MDDSIFEEIIIFHKAELKPGMYFSFFRIVCQYIIDNFYEKKIGEIQISVTPGLNLNINQQIITNLSYHSNKKVHKLFFQGLLFPRAFGLANLPLNSALYYFVKATGSAIPLGSCCL